MQKCLKCSGLITELESAPINVGNISGVICPICHDKLDEAINKFIECWLKSKPFQFR